MIREETSDALHGFVVAVPADKRQEYVESASMFTYPSKEVREAAQKKMQSDERMQNAKFVFDGKRMIYGGFTMVLDR
jgi:uncharacterized protein YbaA (DUF1428 family)